MHVNQPLEGPWLHIFKLWVALQRGGLKKPRAICVCDTCKLPMGAQRASSQSTSKGSLGMLIRKSVVYCGNADFGNADFGNA